MKSKHVIASYAGTLYMFAASDFRLNGSSASVITTGALLPGSLLDTSNLRKFRLFKGTNGVVYRVYSDWSAKIAR